MAKSQAAGVAQAVPQLEPQVHRLLGNRLRYAIFMKLGEEPASPKQLAAKLNQPLKRVSEAIEVLAKAGLVELVDKSPGPRGGIVHTYRASRHVFDPEEWASLPAQLQETTSVAITRVLFNQVSRALETGSFDSHNHRVLIRRPIWVDDEGVEEVDRILSRADAEVADVEKQAAVRRQSSEQTPIRLVTAQLSFPVTSDDWS